MDTLPTVKPIPTHPHVALFGATGFVGQQVHDALRARGATVISVRTPRLDSQTDYERTTEELLKSVKTADVVINAAGLAEPGASTSTLWAANADVPKLLASVCKRAGIRLVHISSAAVLGDTPVIDSRETTRPFSPYSASKAAGERYAQQWHGTVVYRPAGVHGKGRAATLTLARLARSPLSSVAGDGLTTAPQALGANVADAVAFLATTREQPPSIVHHPPEQVTTSGLLRALGDRNPLHLSEKVTRRAVRAVSTAGRRSARMAAIARRLDVLWHGQAIADSWLQTAGWQPPVGPEGWQALGTELREGSNHRLIFGVTSGVSAPPLFTGLFKHLVSEGWTVSLVSSPDGDVERFVKEEHASFLPVNSVRDPSPLNDCRTLVQVVRHLQRQQPRVAVWGTPKMGLLGVLASRLTRTPCVYVVYGLRYQGASGFQKLLLQTVEAVPVALSNEVLTVGHDMKACLEDDHVARAGTVHVIAQGSANGVLPASSSPAVGNAKQPITAVFVGRLTRDKGLQEMINAWKVVRTHDPLATLHLYGRREPDVINGPLATLLDNAEGVIEHGFIENPLTVFNKAQMLLLPTHREGLPTVVLEAGAAGVPTVASNVPGAREPIVNGVTGILVEPENVHDLAAAILSLGTDMYTRSRMGDAARAHVLSNYSRKEVHQFWSSHLSTYTPLVNR